MLLLSSVRQVILLLVLLVIVDSAIAQNDAPFQEAPIQMSVQERWEDAVSARLKVIFFPQFKSGNSIAAQRLNFVIQTLVFGEISSNKSIEKLLRENLHQSLGGEGGITDIEHEMIRNDMKVFSTEIAGEYLGAYPSRFTFGVSVDARTGDRITKEHLVNDMQALEQIVGKRLEQRLAEHIAEYHREDSSEPSEEIVRDLEECDRSLRYTDVLLYKDTVRFLHPKCLPHVIQAYDMDWDISFSYSEIKHLMTDYGKSLFEGPQVEMPYRPGKMEIYTGVVGKAAVTMVLELGDTSITGWYYYDSKGHALSLDGDCFKDEWTLRESDDLSPTGSFTGIATDKGYSGTWRSPDGKRSLPFTLIKLK